MSEVESFLGGLTHEQLFPKNPPPLRKPLLELLSALDADYEARACAIKPWLIHLRTTCRDAARLAHFRNEIPPEYGVDIRDADSAPCACGFPESQLKGERT